MYWLYVVGTYCEKNVCGTGSEDAHMFANASEPLMQKA